jgi:hypothetical protein
VLVQGIHGPDDHDLLARCAPALVASKRSDCCSAAIAGASILAIENIALDETGACRGHRRAGPPRVALIVQTSTVERADRAVLGARFAGVPIVLGGVRRIRVDCCFPWPSERLVFAISRAAPARRSEQTREADWFESFWLLHFQRAPPGVAQRRPSGGVARHAVNRAAGKGRCASQEQARKWRAVRGW